MTLSTPLSALKGVGTTRFTLLSMQGLSSVGDLVSYIPHGYEDSTQVLDLQAATVRFYELPVWERGKFRFTVRALVDKVTKFRTRRGFVIAKAVLSDKNSGATAQAIWFNQPYIVELLETGKEYVFYGKVRKEGNTWSLQSPKFEQVNVDAPLKKLGRIAPVYRKIKSITSTYIGNFITEALRTLEVTEYLPKSILDAHSLPNIADALRQIHQPRTQTEVRAGYLRLALQELLEVREEFEYKFVAGKSGLNPESVREMAKDIAHWLPQLPYKLTSGQEQVLQDLLERLAEGAVLDDLVYGDVGSGKTIILLLLLFAGAKQGASGILIAPTTILASQHCKTAKALSELLGLTQQILVEAVEAGKKKQYFTKNTVYIGTQAILHRRGLLKSPDIKLVCIDEQHRFGVAQRLAVKVRGRSVISLSATPIPRTLALSFLGFSGVHVLHERPAGRREIITKVVPSGKEEATYQWIRKRIESGEQAYLVFPRIEDAEESEQQSLLAMSEMLKEQYFADVSCGVLHGGLKEAEKQRIMADFSAGKIRLLLSTSVIEVGVDVPTATVIVIHGAELFGLAQLHQLRGRVGRSNLQGYCLLLPGNASEEARKRMNFFSTHSEGLAVAEFDLTNRGTGTLLGTYQSGLSELRIASLDDFALMTMAADVFGALRRMQVAIPRYIRVKSDHE